MSVTMRRGRQSCFFSRVRSSRRAAFAARRRCTISSSTVPCWSTARQSQCTEPRITTRISSRCQTSPGRGARRHSSPVMSGPCGPPAHRLVGDIDAALEQQFLYDAQAEREPCVEPDRVGDDLGREAVPPVADGARHGDGASILDRRCKSARLRDIADGQARLLCGSQGEDRPRRRASSPQGDQQRGRSLAPAQPATREGHGAVQVAATGSTVPVGPRSDRCHVPPTPSPPLRKFLPPRKTGRVRPVGRLHDRIVRVSGRLRHLVRRPETT